MKTISPKTRHRHGFTLIELLTVITIIGILAAIIIPVAGRVRKNAMTARATSNIRQLVLAHHAYAVENRDRFPPVHNGDSESPTYEPGSWQNHIAPYVAYKIGTKNDDRYRHRGDPRTIFNVPDSRPWKEQGRHVNAPSINRSFYSNSANFRPSVIPVPSRYILLGECEESNVDRISTLKKSGSDYAHNKGEAPLLPTNTEFGAFRRENGNKALMGFCDGHVKALTREELRDDITPANGNPWRWW
ncbi:N-terminal cleavage protein [Opitutaceae bacterium TAV5]|nr:N-terminal cleavage protein [Opitutaceae bacterium TAV5]